MTEVGKIKFNIEQVSKIVFGVLALAGFWVRFETRMNTIELKMDSQKDGQQMSQAKIEKLEESDAKQNNLLAVIASKYNYIEPHKIKPEINLPE